MATFLKEYPFMTEYYYWNVLTVEKRTIMLMDVTRVDYSKDKKKNKKDQTGVEVVGNVEDLFM